MVDLPVSLSVLWSLQEQSSDEHESLSLSLSLFLLPSLLFFDFFQVKQQSSLTDKINARRKRRAEQVARRGALDMEKELEKQQEEREELKAKQVSVTMKTTRRLNFHDRCQDFFLSFMFLLTTSKDLSVENVLYFF